MLTIPRYLQNIKGYAVPENDGAVSQESLPKLLSLTMGRTGKVNFDCRISICFTLSLSTLFEICSRENSIIRIWILTHRLLKIRSIF